MIKRKYRNKKSVVDGYTFDSVKEARRYIYLRDLQKKGEIYNLELQKSYELLPSQKTFEGTLKSVVYKADFVYFTKDGEEVVEDVKGMRLPAYIIKKKMMYYMHGILIKEV